MTTNLRVLLLATTVSFSLGSQAGVTLQWQDGGKEVDQQVMTILADSRILSDFVALVEQNFELEPSLVLALGSSEGPSMNTDTHVLNLPNGYLAHAIATQSELVEDRDEALERALDVVEYTLYYLLGHALASSAPLAGKQNFDVDLQAEAMSTWVTLGQWDNGGEQWFANVSAFADASQKLDGSLDDFWHRHSLYQLREDQIGCWILGQDPAAHARLLPAALSGAKRRQSCAARWSALNDATLKALDPVLKRDSPLRQP